jgi:hypothetical protein
MKTPAIAGLLAFSAIAPAEELLKFRSLFNGKDLTGWAGEGYIVEDGNIVCTPNGKNLATEATFAAYVLDFNFKLEPGTNNGLGIHFPGHGDGAYTGMELQILDNYAEKWKDLKDYQYHGSMYTLLPAKKEALLPAGEWNHQRVSVAGSLVEVILNGQTILKANLDELAKKHPDHEGVKRRSGQIAFLGHGDKISFRNINVFEIVPPAHVKGVKSAGYEQIFNGKDLTGWKYQSSGDDNWLASHDILKHTGKKAETNDLWTEKSYKDFTMVFDWRWAQIGQQKAQPVVLPDGTEKLGQDGKKELVEIEELDSGIFLRGSSKSQINLWNWNCGSGEIYGYRIDPKQSPEVKAACTPKRKADFPVGQWNRMMITVKGQQVSVTMNGHTIIENATLDDMPAEGPIGLQHHGQAIDFANIWVKSES